MTRIRQIRNNFSGGIISKEVYGNVDLEQFNNSLEICDNMIKQATGGLAKRTGTLYIASEDIAKDNYKLIPYPLSDGVAFILRVEGYNSRILITAYLVDDLSKTYTTTVALKYLYTPSNFKDIFYVQNKTTVLIFIGRYIVRVNIQYDKKISDYVLSAVSQAYSFPPFGTAYSGSLFPVFMDNGDPNSNDGKGYGIFMNSAAFAALHEWSYKNYPEDGWDCAAKSYTEFSNNVSKTMIPDSGYYKIQQFIMENSYSFEEYQELMDILIDPDRAPEGPRKLMLNYVSTDSSQPNLSWVIELTHIDKVFFLIDTDPERTKFALTFEYKFIDEYCPTTTVTFSESLKGANKQIEKTIRQDLPQLLKIDSHALRYLNTAQPSNWRYEVFLRREDHFVSAGVYENRLYLGGMNDNPNIIVASSRTYQDWLNFSTGTLAGDGLIENISSDYGIQIIKWLCGSYKLFIGTTDGVFVMGGISNSTTESITPANAHAVLISSVPTCELQPLRAMDTVFFVDSSGKRIYEIAYNEQHYSVNELSLLARDLYRSGVKSHAYMSMPHKLYWACMNDGTLVSMTYLKNINSLSASRHILGTYADNMIVQTTASYEGRDFSNINNTATKINDIISINKGDLNMIVMDVTRYRYGESFSRTLEVFNYSLHDDPGNISQYYVDCGFELLRYGNIVSISPDTTLRFEMGTNYSNFEALFLAKDWIGVGSNNPQHDILLQPINVDIYRTSQQTISTLSNKNVIFIYKRLNDDGSFVNFIPGDIPFLDNSGVVIDDFYFWLGFSDFTFSEIQGYSKYRFCDNLALRIYKDLESDHYKLIFDLSLSDFPIFLKVNFIDSGLVDKNGESIDGIHIFSLNSVDHLYYPDDSNLFVIRNKELSQDCGIAISFPGVFRPIAYTSPLYSSLIMLDNGKIPGLGINSWHKCLITNIPEVPQINNREIYLRFKKSFSKQRPSKDYIEYNISYLKDNVYEAIPIISEELSTVISVSGYCYFPYKYSEIRTHLARCSHFNNSKICLVLNRFFYTVQVDVGDLVLSDQQQLFGNGQEYWYVAAGFNYCARIKTTPSHFFSPLVGESTGLVAYQSEVTLQMYGCYTGYIGADFNRMNLIPYRGKKNDDSYQIDIMDPQVQLINCHVFPSKDVYNSSVCIADNSPSQFQILSITQDVEYSDQ